MKKRTQTGFTLYELLMTMLIVGVVLALGIPNFAEFTQSSRITSTANDLHAAFQMSRSESARAKTNITICASDNAFDADAACGGTWEQGYIVFIDNDADLARTDVSETILRSHEPAAEGVSLAIANDATYFMYASSGLGRQDINGNQSISQVIICDERGTTETAKDMSAARLFVSTPLGRATIVRDYTTVDDALTAMGKNCP